MKKASVFPFFIKFVESIRLYMCHFHHNDTTIQSAFGRIKEFQ